MVPHDPLRYGPFKLSAKSFEEKNKRKIIERKNSKQKDFVKFGLEYFVINKFWKEKSWCKIFVQAKI